MCSSLAGALSGRRRALAAPAPVASSAAHVRFSPVRRQHRVVGCWRDSSGWLWLLVAETARVGRARLRAGADAPAPARLVDECDTALRDPCHEPVRRRARHAQDLGDVRLPPRRLHLGRGVQYGHAAGAISYTIKYWDGLANGYVTTTVAAKDASANDKQVGKGKHLLGVTGGTWSAPCDVPVDFSGVKARFNKGAEAWATYAKAPSDKPSISVEVVTPSGVAIGGSAQVKVVVTAGPRALTAVSVDGLSGGGAIAEVTKRPGGSSGFALAARASRSFAYTVKGVKAGAAALRARARGTSKKGSVSGSGVGTFRVAKEALAITMSMAPKKIDLAVDDEGKIAPQEVTLTVKLTNTGSNTLRNVTLQSLNPRPVNEADRLAKLALPRGTLPLTIGDMAPKAPSTRTFKLRVTGDGNYEGRRSSLSGRTPADGAARVQSPRRSRSSLARVSGSIRSRRREASFSSW